MNRPFSLLPAGTAFDPARTQRDNETQLLDRVDQGLRYAIIQEASPGISVPRSYQRNPRFETACKAMDDAGIPVAVRLSGGGVVPQAPGVINLHLAYPIAARYPLEHAESQYLGLCELITRVLAAYGINAQYQNVQGSFCDGRFNLAVDGKKIAGTAQYWRRNKTAATPTFSLLSHAVILVNADCIALTDMANRFEGELHSTVRYLPEKTTSVMELLGKPASGFEQALWRELQNPPV